MPGGPHYETRRKDLATLLADPTGWTKTKLNLAGGQITAADAIDLATALQVNTTITDLCLCINNIKGAGARALAKAFEVNTTIRKVNLGFNQIDYAGAKALAEAFKVNTTITEVIFIGNEISGALEREIEAIIKNIDERRRCRVASFLESQVLRQQRQQRQLRLKQET